MPLSVAASIPMSLEISRRFRRSIVAQLLLLCSAGLVNSNSQTAVTSSSGPAASPEEEHLRTAAAVDYSKEGVVIQSLSRQVSFHENGSWQSVETASVRIQSDAGVQQLGVLAFSYDRDEQQFELTYLRVRKPDGKIVETPRDNMQDVSSEISKAAPTYSDLREKQVPVKSLGVGDVLEYQFRRIQIKPEVPGQFWYAQNFTTDSVILEETLAIDVPSNRYVKVVSPKLKPEITEASGRKTYSWKTAQLEPTSQKTNTKSSPDSPFASVQVTTFKTWEEVGRWYAGLQSPRVAVSAAIQAKADELTKGLSGDEEKARALYNYVSTKFRYVSLSFGVGRFQPHAAEEVLANQYGDCKDKHTLFAALLKAAGIQAWPALIGYGVKIDPDVPSPAQFNHVITIIAGRQGKVWVDTTPEIAPYGLLVSALRDQKALQVSTDAPPALVTTPAAPPFPASEILDVQATLNSEGVLTGHFDFTVRGDDELILRSAFHQLPPARWLELVQQIVRSNGFAGTVSNLDADSPELLVKPFHYSFDYTRSDYSDWQNRRIIPPLLPLLLLTPDASAGHAEPFFLGAPGEFRYRARLHLPNNYSADIPVGENIHTDFADFESSYLLKDNELTASRRLTIKQQKIPFAARDAYRKFAENLAEDNNQFIPLKLLSTSAAPYQAGDNPGAATLLVEAFRAGERRDFNAMQEYLTRAERVNPNQTGLSAAYGAFYLSTNEPQKGIEALQKEIHDHPSYLFAYLILAKAQSRLRNPYKAIETLRNGLKLMPSNMEMAADLAQLLMREKRYAEVPAVLQPVLEKSTSQTLQGVLADALLRSGDRKAGLAALDKYAQGEDPLVLNNAAFSLADVRTDLPLAKEYAEKAVSKLEEASNKLTLPSPKGADLQLMQTLSAAWDTLGWVDFQTGNLIAAENYIAAAWDLSQRGEVGDHLGQIYLAEGKKKQAIHTWQLALAADNSLTSIKESLQSAGAPAAPQPLMVGHSAKILVSPAEELGKLRTLNLPNLSTREGSAEFFLLFSSGKLEAVQFIKGSDSLKEADIALKAADLRIRPPDTNRQKILRRGILFCSRYTTPSCHFVMLLPATSTAAVLEGKQRADKSAQAAAAIQQPTLLTQQEPKYSQAALQAKVEGRVVLSIVVDENGIPQDITVINSLGFGLDEEARDCVAQWRFKPGTKNGIAVRTQANVEVNFKLAHDSQ